jgi:hypothetical protein
VNLTDDPGPFLRRGMGMLLPAAIGLPPMPAAPKNRVLGAVAVNNFTATNGPAG